MARKLIATLLAKTSAVMMKSVACDGWKKPMAPSVAALATAAIRYQVLLFSVVSTIGAHSAFQVCGSRLIATSPATAATLTPAWDSR